MTPLRAALTIAVIVFGASASTLWLFFRLRRRAKRSRIPSIAHQIEGPYRKRGERRRK